MTPYTFQRLQACLLMAASLHLALPVLAQSSALAQAPAAAATSPAPVWAEGEIRRVDREGQKITLRHGEIKNLDMPPMTMVFQVKDPALLAKAGVGDKVRFTAVQETGRYVVTDLVKAAP
jgi:Cu(I)/Ag(I) efflux system protein CusF